VRESGGCREAACRAREMSLKRGGGEEEGGRRLQRVWRGRGSMWVSE
jgi:hypothetical protein